MQSGSPAFTLEPIPRIPHRNLKPHAHSVLDHLNDDHRAQLHQWLKDGVPYRTIVEKMRKELGVQTHIKSISVYYAKLKAGELLERRAKSLGVADELSDAITRKPANFNKAIFDLVEHSYFDLLSDSEAHPTILEIYSKQYQRLMDLQLRNRQARIKERRIKLLERQAAEARETLESKLSPEQQAAVLRRIMYPSDYADEAHTEKNGTNGNGCAA